MSEQDFWIVWNEAKNEGVIFDNAIDAHMTAEGAASLRQAMREGFSVPTSGQAFAETYEDDALVLQKVRLPTPTEGD